MLLNGNGALELIFNKEQNKFHEPAKLLQVIVDFINEEVWSSMDAEVKSVAYAALSERNARDTKSGAGQYFRLRPLVQVTVDALAPGPRAIAPS